jgi:NitT/TauT family transport system substrate-binding protein
MARPISALPRIRVLRALKQGIDFIHAQPAQSQAIVLQRLQVDTGLIDWVRKDFRFGLCLEQSLLITLENEALWTMDNGFVKASTLPNMLDHVYPDGLLQIDPSTITIFR